MKSLAKRVRESEEITDDVALEIVSTSQFNMKHINFLASMGARYHRETRTIVNIESWMTNKKY